jgi:hypothetical protein
VLSLLATDLSAREIGGQLFLSPNTVRSHTRAIYRRLDVHSRSEAVARADARTAGHSGFTHVNHASSGVRAGRACDARCMSVREYSLSAGTTDENDFGHGAGGTSTEAVAGMQS